MNNVRVLVYRYEYADVFCIKKHTCVTGGDINSR